MCIILTSLHPLTLLAIYILLKAAYVDRLCTRTGLCRPLFYVDPLSYIYIYIYIIHMVISAFGVFVNTFWLPDDIPWVGTSRRE